jgi:hypothetical protein
MLVRPLISLQARGLDLDYWKGRARLRTVEVVRTIQTAQLAVCARTRRIDAAGLGTMTMHPGTKAMIQVGI